MPIMAKKTERVNHASSGIVRGGGGEGEGDVMVVARDPGEN